MEGGTIGGNTAASGGGGVHVVGHFTMSGGSVTGNAAGSTGGGVHAAGNFTMSGGSVSGNAAGSTGGGVYVTGSGNFTISGGSVGGNTAASGGGGVLVTGPSSSFKMSGSAAVHTNNPVRLDSGRVITLSGSLSANPAANIETSSTGILVLGDDPGTPDNDITDGDNYKKFWLNGQSNAAGNKIDSFGRILSL
jgi:hypothetical protein